MKSNYSQKSNKSKHIGLIYIILVFGLLGFMLLTADHDKELLSPIPTGAVQVYAETPALQEEAAPVEEVTPLEVDTSEKAQILAYIVEVFGEHAADAITMIRKCENSKFNPHAMNKGNNNGTWDVGIFQMNVDPANTAEVEKLQDWKYNIDQAYKKFQAKNNTFYYWTCGHEVGHYTYVDYLNGR